MMHISGRWRSRCTRQNRVAAENKISIPQYPKVLLQPWTVADARLQNRLLKMGWPNAHDAGMKVSVGATDAILSKDRGTLDLPEGVRQTMLEACLEGSTCPGREVLRSFRVVSIMLNSSINGITNLLSGDVRKSMEIAVSISVGWLRKKRTSDVNPLAYFIEGPVFGSAHGKL